MHRILLAVLLSASLAAHADPRHLDPIAGGAAHPQPERIFRSGHDPERRPLPKFPPPRLLPIQIEASNGRALAVFTFGWGK